VIVTCYQQAPYVVECLDAVAAQTFRDLELLVCDDDSQDATPQVVQRWLAAHPDLDARFLDNAHNLGLIATLNRALTECRGPYVAYCGGDDVWRPELLERAVAELDRRGPGTAAVYADAVHIDEHGTEIAPSFLREQGQEVAPQGQVFDELIRCNFVPTPTVTYRRDAIEAVGGWDPELYFEDWDLLLRLADRYEIAAVDEVLASYRVHDESMTRQGFSSMIESRLQLLAKWLGRDEATDDVVVPFLQEQSWRLYKVHPDLARHHVAVAYSVRAGLMGRLRRLVATSHLAEGAFEVGRRVTRPWRRSRSA
jgi:glycosyltransferase involved in cell wall biosynthesis